MKFDQVLSIRQSTRRYLEKQIESEQMEKKAAKTGEKPLMTNFAVYNLARNNTFDYSKAERELGYHTRPYAETLADEARWLIAEGYVKAHK